jgi:AraC-like DNA-binding protein
MDPLSDDSISVIALSLGYESESAFGKAFKRVMGSSPRQYSRRSSPPPPSATTTEANYSDQMEEAPVG